MLLAWYGLKRGNDDASASGPQGGYAREDARASVGPCADAHASFREADQGEKAPARASKLVQASYVPPGAMRCPTARALPILRCSHAGARRRTAIGDAGVAAPGRA